ncbi:MAG: hypothetical protein DHS20C18_24720 [Saprospiraceae bacterium]|nr:MAG: hypothetical protein DHS20C18_24720 [Saprospiraceae bacterium]
MLLLISINGILIIISILFDINFHESEIGSIERAVGLYSNPNRAGFVSCIGQATAIFLIADNNDFNKKIIAICYLITLAAALATFSKAATLVSIILLMRVFFVKRFTSKWKGRYLNYLRFTLFAIVVFLILNFNSIYSSLSQKQASRYTQLYSFLQGNVSNETTTQRAEIAMFAWDKIKDQWVFGYGVGTFEKMDIGFGTHNQYLLLWGNAGIFGLFVYLAFFVIWYIKASKLSHKNYKTYSINMLLIILASSFTSHTILVNKQYIVALGLLFSAYNYYVFQRKRIPNNIVI